MKEEERINIIKSVLKGKKIYTENYRIGINTYDILIELKFCGKCKKSWSIIEASGNILNTNTKVLTRNCGLSIETTNKKCLCDYDSQEEYIENLLYNNNFYFKIYNKVRTKDESWQFLFFYAENDFTLSDLNKLNMALDNYENKFAIPLNKL